MRAPQSPDDQTLIGRINCGDPAAFAVLYERYRSWVMRLARRHVPTEADAQDVVQDTFMYLLRKSPGLELRARMTTFLYPVVRNLARAAAARAGRFGTPSDTLEPVAAGPEEPSELAHLIRSLPEEQREVLLMRFVDDMTGPEIAEALGIPQGTVKSRLHHGLRKLRGG